MSVMNSAEIKPSNCLYNLEEIEQALSEMSRKINHDYMHFAAQIEEKEHDRDSLLVIGIMTGAVVVMGHLLPKLNLPVEVDYIHVSRYGDKTQGEDLKWLAYPKASLKGRSILLVDDIFDEGLTLQAVTRYCLKQGAKEVKSCVLLDKQHQRKTDYSVDYVALSVLDRYVFGFGLDYRGRLRNAPGIYALTHNE